MKTIEKTAAGWRLDNSYARLPKIFYTDTQPTAVKAPKMVIFNHGLAQTLGLDADTLQGEEGAAFFAGNRLPQGASPLAQAYAGHQFGYFTMLGDGRAILLGEQIAPSGTRYDIQLKGAGRTPYSRQGDGRATVGPMLREYIISEAMHALGIPTTRSLAVVTTGELVARETPQPGAVLVRVAASHLRVGTFEYAANWGSEQDLRALADYTLERHFPGFEDAPSRYLHLLTQVVRRQAELIAGWQLVGFIHGVMNTDNMALSGESIDYGPCAFMDTYDPQTVFSSIDLKGRYAYENQPHIAGWNLARFAEALLPLLHENQDEAVRLAQEAVSGFTEQYKHAWLAGMRAKLGLEGQGLQDEKLITDLLDMMKESKADYTNTFLALTFDTQDSPIFGVSGFADWQMRWRERQAQAGMDKEAIRQLMRSSNPAVIPRNHRVEAALEAAAERQDYSVMEALLRALSDPFAHSCEQAEYATPPGSSGRPYRTFCGT